MTAAMIITDAITTVPLQRCQDHSTVTMTVTLTITITATVSITLITITMLFA